MLATKPLQPPILETVLKQPQIFSPKTLDEYLMAKEDLQNFVPKTLDEWFLIEPVVQFGTSVAFKRFVRRQRRTIAGMIFFFFLGWVNVNF